MPKIPDSKTWQQAELISQPAYIRLVDNLRKRVESSDWNSSFEEITEPYPGHAICLQRADQTIRYPLAALCFQICFTNYDLKLDVAGTQVVTVDPSLFDADSGEVDWDKLEMKTQAVLDQFFDDCAQRLATD